MTKEITITKKNPEKKKDDGFRVVSVRMREDLVECLDNLANEANRSRNEVINLLLEKAVEIVKVD